MTETVVYPLFHIVITYSQRAKVASYSSLIVFTLKMKAIHSSETSISTRTTRRHIPEDGILHSPWLLAYQSAEIISVYRLMVGTLNTCSSSARVKAISFCVYQLWIINKLFKQIFCMLKCTYTFWTSVHNLDYTVAVL
jgi:hypothetical protein